MQGHENNPEFINRITEYGLPHEIIETCYGSIRRIDWQKLEAKRIGDCRIHKWAGQTAIVKGLKNVSFSY